MFDVNPNILSQVLEHYENQPFLISEKRSWTFADFMSEARFLSDSLMAESQQRVYLSSENPENLFKSMLSLWMHGAVAVPLNPKIPEKHNSRFVLKTEVQSNPAQTILKYPNLLETVQTRVHLP